MNWLISIIFQFFLCIICVVIGHHIFTYIKNTFSRKVIKDVYHTQVEKYKELIEEIKYNETSNESMEDELNRFLEDSINE
jgi:benzoyl-CoA reductase/2-hydroxyglutaryl-CoA dehydratase subunit BcrC/BadD/HgdB